MSTLQKSNQVDFSLQPLIADDEIAWQCISLNNQYHFFNFLQSFKCSDIILPYYLSTPSWSDRHQCKRHMLLPPHLTPSTYDVIARSGWPVSGIIELGPVFLGKTYVPAQICSVFGEPSTSLCSEKVHHIFKQCFVSGCR